MTPAATVEPVNDYAIVVNPKDNVAVVKAETAAGLELMLGNGRTVRLKVPVPAGHRFATRDIPAGKFVLQYGQKICPMRCRSIKVADGEIMAKAEINKHREFQFWAEQTVTL